MFQASPYNSGRVLGRSPPLVKWGGFGGTSPSRVGGFWGLFTGGQNAPTILRGGGFKAPPLGRWRNNANQRSSGASFSSSSGKTSTNHPRRQCMVDLTPCMVVHFSMELVIIVCSFANAMTQQIPILNPMPDTPTPPGWASPCSQVLQNSPPRNTRCGLTRDAPPPPPLTRTFQTAGAFTHTFSFNE
jgi:hypothetical protein